MPTDLKPTYDKAVLRELLERVEGLVAPITMQDVRLAVGEGPLSPLDVLNGCNAELRRRSALKSMEDSHPVSGSVPSPVGEGEWRPIESAPRDGTDILAYFQPIKGRLSGVFQVAWINGIWTTDDHKHGPYPMRRYCDGDDTHWAPLP